MCSASSVFLIHKIPKLLFRIIAQPATHYMTHRVKITIFRTRGAEPRTLTQRQPCQQEPSPVALDKSLSSELPGGRGGRGGRTGRQSSQKRNSRMERAVTLEYKGYRRLVILLCVSRSASQPRTERSPYSEVWGGGGPWASGAPTPGFWPSAKH